MDGGSDRELDRWRDEGWNRGRGMKKEGQSDGIRNGRMGRRES